MALLVAAGLYATLPGNLILGGGVLRWIVPVLEVALIIVAAVNPVAESEHRRHVGIFLVVLITLANASALGLLIDLLLTQAGFNGGVLILSAIQIWTTNVMIFGLWYWEVDGGGPRRRHLDPAGPAGFLFPQWTQPEPWRWKPRFADYLYVSVTNSMAFSPTDAMPLERRIKALMAVQAAISMLTILLVAARAVNILR